MMKKGNSMAVINFDDVLGCGRSLDSNPRLMAEKMSSKQNGKRKTVRRVLATTKKFTTHNLFME